MSRFARRPRRWSFCRRMPFGYLSFFFLVAVFTGLLGEGFAWAERSNSLNRRSAPYGATLLDLVHLFLSRLSIQCKMNLWKNSVRERC